MTNPLIHTLATTIAKERTMMKKPLPVPVAALLSVHAGDDTANDRREGYCDGMSRKFQGGRSAAYVAGNWDGWQDDARLAGAKPAAPVTIWQRVINWLRATLS